MRRAWKLMTTYKRGDVLLVRFPNVDWTSFKLRPALIVQSDELKTEFRQRAAVSITSNLSRIGPSRIRINKDSSKARSMGLVLDSVVMTDRLVTIPEALFHKKIGRLEEMEPVDQALKLVLGL